MDTKKLRELAEVLDALSAAKVTIYDAESGTIERIIVVQVVSPNEKTAPRIKDALTSAVATARNQVESEIRSEANKGHLMPRTPEKDPFSSLTRGWPYALVSDPTKL